MRLINIWKHFYTITEHKVMVARHCFRVGMYWQGITHDLSKYTPAEFLQGCKYYQGFQSPNNAEREDKGYSAAWLHHKGRNKHHYEYWIDYSLKPRRCMAGMKMPMKWAGERRISDTWGDKRAFRIYASDAWPKRRRSNVSLYEKIHDWKETVSKD